VDWTPSRAVSGRGKGFALAAIGYTALAIVQTYPLVVHLSSRIAADLGDPLLSTSILWWNTHAVPLTARWWNGFAFSPATGMLAFSDHRLGLSLMASPLQWLGASPVTAYNLVFLATFPLCALAGHALGWTLTSRHDAAAICGLAFGFNPFRVAHRSHLELLAGFGMPLALAALHLYLRDRRTRWIVAFGLSLILLGLSSMYYLLFFSVMLALWVLWFVRDWKTMGAIATAALGAAVALLPIALGYRRIHAFYGFARTHEDVTSLSADLTSFFASPPQVALWGFTAPLATGPFPGEHALFPGLTISLLAAVACVMVIRARSSAAAALRRSAPMPFYVLAAGVLFLCAMGPVPTFLGKPILRQGPYAWLMMLPVFSESIRAPARFGLPALLALATAAALAFNRLTLVPSTRRALAIALLTGIVADSWMRRFETPRVPESWRAPAGYDFETAIELPMSEFGDFAAMYRATRHGHPIANGHSGFVPSYYLALQTSLAEGTLRGLDALGDGKPLLIVLDTVADPYGRWTLALTEEPHVTKVGEDGRWVFYGMNATASVRSCDAPEVPVVAAMDGRGAIDTTALTDGTSTTAWTTGRPQQRDDAIQLELAEAAHLCQLRFSMGALWEAFPRDLEVTTSDNGTSWTPRFEGSPAGLVVRGAIANPKDIWVAVPLDGAYARFVRLRLKASHPTAPWRITELRVSGSRG